MDAAAKEKTATAVRSLAWQKLVRFYRWQYIQGYVFTDSAGEPTFLHAYSRCVLKQGREIVLDSNDIVVPGQGVEPDPEDDYGFWRMRFR